MKRKFILGALAALYIVLLGIGIVAWLPPFNNFIAEDVTRDTEGNIYITRQGYRRIHVYQMDADGNAMDLYWCRQEAKEANNYCEYEDGKLYICQIWYYWDEKGMLCFSVWEKEEGEQFFQCIWKKALEEDISITDFHVENGVISLSGIAQDKEEILLYRWEDGTEKNTLRFDSGFIPTEVYLGNGGLYALSHDNNVYFIDMDGKKYKEDLDDVVMLCTGAKGFYYQQTGSRDLEYILYDRISSFTYEDVGSFWDIEFSDRAQNNVVLLNDKGEDLVKIIGQDGTQKEISHFQLNAGILFRQGILPFFFITMLYAILIITGELMYHLVWKKRRLLYQTMTAIIVFSAVWLTVTIIALHLYNQKNERNDRLFYAATSRDIQKNRMEEEIKAEQLNQLQSTEQQKIFRDIFLGNIVKTAWADFFIREEVLFEKDDPQVMFSEEAAYGRKANTFYMTSTVAKIKECMNGGEDSAMAFCDKVDGVMYAIAITRLGTDERPVCLLSRVPLLGVGHKDNKLPLFYIGAVLGWIVVMVFLGLFLRKKWDATRILVAQMDKVSKGDYRIGNWKVPDNEFGMMWTALERMCKNLQLRKYKETGVMEYIYQFAPKNFESLLAKESLEEIEVGEAVLLPATMGIISIIDKDTLLKGKLQKQYVQYVNQLMEILFSQDGSEQAVFLQSGSNLESVKVIFKGEGESAMEAVQYSIDCIESLLGQTEAKYETKPFILLHTSRFRCGIAGGSKQIYPYVASIEMETLNLYITPLKDSGAKIVVTEETWVHMQGSLHGRYIGYVKSKDGQYTFQLYEIVDACPQGQKMAKQKNSGQFAQALELYYANALYDARNAFAQILKECPEDGIARWYASVCDSLYNEGIVAESHELFWNL